RATRGGRAGRAVERPPTMCDAPSALDVRPSAPPIVEKLRPRTAVTGPSLSVVIPVFNEGRRLASTLEALIVALDGSGFEADIVVVDDGSTDGSGELARDSVDGRLPVRVLRQPNLGRFEARGRGLDAAEG